MPRKKFGRNRKNRCRFCTRDGCPRPAYVDYKDIGLLKKLCTNQNKMFSRKRSGSCAAFQRASSAAVKRARFMALLPYVGEQSRRARAPSSGVAPTSPRRQRVHGGSPPECTRWRFGLVSPQSSDQG